MNTQDEISRFRKQLGLSPGDVLVAQALCGAMDPHNLVSLSQDDLSSQTALKRRSVFASLQAIKEKGLALETDLKRGRRTVLDMSPLLAAIEHLKVQDDAELPPEEEEDILERFSKLFSKKKIKPDRPGDDVFGWGNEVDLPCPPPFVGMDTDEDNYDDDYVQKPTAEEWALMNEPPPPPGRNLIPSALSPDETAILERARSAIFTLEYEDGEHFRKALWPRIHNMLAKASIFLSFGMFDDCYRILADSVDEFDFVAHAMIAEIHYRSFVAKE